MERSTDDICSTDGFRNQLGEKRKTALAEKDSKWLLSFVREGDYIGTGIRVGSVGLRVHFRGVCHGGMNNMECYVQ